MKLIKKKLSELKKAKKNVRIHPEEQIKEYKRSLKVFGQVKPLTIDENNVILTGNGMYEAMCSLGWKEAYCNQRHDLSEHDKKKLMIADNRIFSLGEDDKSAIKDVLAELEDNLDIPGCDDELIDLLLEEARAGSNKFIFESEDNSYNSERVRTPEIMEYEPAAVKSEHELSNEHPQTSVDERGKLSQPIKKSVVCPHCGETIWL